MEFIVKIVSKVVNYEKIEANSITEAYDIADTLVGEVDVNKGVVVEQEWESVEGN